MKMIELHGVVAHYISGYGLSHQFLKITSSVWCHILLACKQESAYPRHELHTIYNLNRKMI